ncbi:GNAT family N-acetyltransferase [Burkholderiaceae bacterium FT117]|uniref:GNAT family N-acetyltransferase n=1 Tax=Zeimonas sediminis TaxID=2944268 RepID=UPI002342C14A|nr:GNAT family N-acetyltransferase [Zeimonas sediminis]MCM5569709.1 GNAT family N-acetyltransferase [Zeimonas sediminis]
MRFEIVRGWLPGAIGGIVALHGEYYHRKAGFGLYFETKVARELAEFACRHDDARDGLWLAVSDGRVEGSIVIDGIDARGEGAHLRWFIVSDRLRGRGAGKALIGAALDFCRARGYRDCHLWTFAGLDAARHLYERNGFRLTRQARGAQWGVEVDEQRFDLRLEA